MNLPNLEGRHIIGLFEGKNEPALKLETPLSTVNHIIVHFVNEIKEM